MFDNNHNLWYTIHSIDRLNMTHYQALIQLCKNYGVKPMVASGNPRKFQYQHNCSDGLHMITGKSVISFKHHGTKLSFPLKGKDNKLLEKLQIHEIRLLKVDDIRVIECLRLLEVPKLRQPYAPQKLRHVYLWRTSIRVDDKLNFSESDFINYYPVQPFELDFEDMFDELF